MATLVLLVSQLLHLKHHNSDSVEAILNQFPCSTYSAGKNKQKMETYGYIQAAVVEEEEEELVEFCLDTLWP